MVVRLPKLSLVVRTWVSEAVKSSRLGSSRLLGCGGGSVSPRSVGAIAHRRMGIWRTPRVVPVRRALAPSLPWRALWRGVSLRATLFRAFAGCVDPHIGRGWVGHAHVRTAPHRPGATPPCAVEPCRLPCVWRLVLVRLRDWWAVRECFTFPGSNRRFPGTRLREAETE